MSSDSVASARSAAALASRMATLIESGAIPLAFMRWIACSASSRVSNIPTTFLMALDSGWMGWARRPRGAGGGSAPDGTKPDSGSALSSLEGKPRAKSGTPP
jgi:hypothetical protein